MRRDPTRQFGGNVKKYLITGVIILLPVALTIMIAVFLFELFTTPFVPIVKSVLHHFSFSLPEEATRFFSRLIALVLLVVFIILLGMIARHFLFKNLASMANRILYKIPFVKTVYKVSRDIFTALFSPDGKQAFKETVSIPFPYPPHVCIGFSSGQAPKECEEKVGEPLVSVFAPTAPHPISGFLFLVPKKDVASLEAMTKEDAIKFLVSCGVIHPQTENTNGQ